MEINQPYFIVDAQIIPQNSLNIIILSNNISRQHIFHILQILFKPFDESNNISKLIMELLHWRILPQILEYQDIVECCKNCITEYKNILNNSSNIEYFVKYNYGDGECINCTKLCCEFYIYIYLRHNEMYLFKPNYNLLSFLYRKTWKLQKWNKMQNILQNSVRFGKSLYNSSYLRIIIRDKYNNDTLYCNFDSICSKRKQRTLILQLY